MKKRNINKETSKLLNASSIGLSFGISIAIGTWMGYWLDGKFGTKPWCTLVFMLFGIAAGFKNMIYFMRRSGVFDKDDE